LVRRRRARGVEVGSGERAPARKGSRGGGSRRCNGRDVGVDDIVRRISSGARVSCRYDTVARLLAGNDDRVGDQLVPFTPGVRRCGATMSWSTTRVVDVVTGRIGSPPSALRRPGWYRESTSSAAQLLRRNGAGHAPTRSTTNCRGGRLPELIQVRGRCPRSEGPRDGAKDAHASASSTPPTAVIATYAARRPKSICGRRDPAAELDLPSTTPWRTHTDEAACVHEIGRLVDNRTPGVRRRRVFIQHQRSRERRFIEETLVRDWAAVPPCRGV